MIRLRRRSKDNKQRREQKMKKQIALRKQHVRLQKLAKRLASDAQQYIKLAAEGTAASSGDSAAICRSPKAKSPPPPWTETFEQVNGFGGSPTGGGPEQQFMGVMPGNVASPDKNLRTGKDLDHGSYGPGMVDDYNQDGDQYDYYEQEGTKTPARVAATRAAAAAAAAQAVALAAVKLVQLAEQQLRDAELENDSDDESFIREMEEGMIETGDIDPLFDEDFDTVTIGDTGFQYKVRAGGLDGAPDLGDDELDKLYSESWRAAMQVELGGGGGGNKRNPVAGGGNNYGGSGAAVLIQLPSVAARARQTASESAMSSLGPTRPPSATMMRDAGNILSVNSFTDDSFEEGELVRRAVGVGQAVTSTGGGGGGSGVRRAAEQEVRHAAEEALSGIRPGDRNAGTSALGSGFGGFDGESVDVDVNNGGFRGGGLVSKPVLVRRIDGDFDRD